MIDIVGICLGVIIVCMVIISVLIWRLVMNGKEGDKSRVSRASEVFDIFNEIENVEKVNTRGCSLTIDIDLDMNNKKPVVGKRGAQVKMHSYNYKRAEVEFKIYKNKRNQTNYIGYCKENKTLYIRET